MRSKLVARRDFIHAVPHMSFVIGDKDVQYLKKRHAAMAKSPLFAGMQYTEDHSVLREWFPLIMEGRDPKSKVAATRMDAGTDVNFGALTRYLISHLTAKDKTVLKLSHRVTAIKRDKTTGLWNVAVKNLRTGHGKTVRAKFVFVGAGGGSLPLLTKTGIPEARGYGGFPVSGLFLRCTNAEVIARHLAKVYGKAAIGAPPMSVPHLDSRVINGKQELLFGPFAGFSTKFLKSGSYPDLPASINFRNIIPMLQAGIDNIPLTRYLLQQLWLSHVDRVAALHEYYPEARAEDWELRVAGQRAQVIEKNAQGRGTLEFGTELVHAADRSVAALLGASPGASTAVLVALEVLQTCFPEKINSHDWQKQLSMMIPSYGKSLAEGPTLLKTVRQQSFSALGLKPRP